MHKFIILSLFLLLGCKEIQYAFPVITQKNKNDFRIQLIDTVENYNQNLKQQLPDNQGKLIQRRIPLVYVWELHFNSEKKGLLSSQYALKSGDKTYTIYSKSEFLKEFPAYRFDQKYIYKYYLLNERNISPEKSFNKLYFVSERIPAQVKTLELRFTLEKNDNQSENHYTLLEHRLERKIIDMD